MRTKASVVAKQLSMAANLVAHFIIIFFLVEKT